MNMEEFVQKLNTYVTAHEPNFGDGESVLTLFYEAYAGCNKMDNGTIRNDLIIRRDQCVAVRIHTESKKIITALP